MDPLRTRLAAARSISVPGRILLGSAFSLASDSDTAVELEWLAGYEPELHLETPGTSAFLRLVRLRPLVLAGHVADERGASRLLHVGTTARGLIEAGGRQYLRGLFNARDEVIDASRRGILAPSRSRNDCILHYEAAACDFSCFDLLELILVEAYCRLLRGKHPLRAMLTTFASAPGLGASLDEHPALRDVAPLAGGGSDRQVTDS
jgi:hypothetical protein